MIILGLVLAFVLLLVFLAVARIKCHEEEINNLREEIAKNTKRIAQISEIVDKSTLSIHQV